MKVKITKINNLCIYPTGTVGWTAVHFKLDGIDHFLLAGEECEQYMHLYRGRCKCHLEHVSSCYGYDYDLIRFTRKPRCLKYVDTDHFLEELKKYNLL